jgi:hypothetical protein
LVAGGAPSGSEAIMTAGGGQMSYRILCNDILIGYSDLEGRDQGMAVAYGRFVPTAGYEQFRSMFRLRTEAESQTNAQSGNARKLDVYDRQIARPSLTIQTAAGASLSTGWIEVRDFSVEAGEYEISAHLDDPTFWDR